jgi:BASS family bile acid:Na+ symporter
VKHVVDVAIPVITFLLLTAVGLDLAREDFRRVRREPRVLAIGLLAPLFALPLVALALIRAFAPPPAVEAGLLLVAVCPIGGISNTYSYLARAATALSVTLTGLSCLLAVATVPLLTRVFERVIGRTLGFDVTPGLLLIQLAFMLAAPVGLGMWIRSRWPGFAAARRSAIQRLGFAALGLLVVFVTWVEFDAFRAGVASTVPLSAAFVAVSFAIGWVAAVTGRADRRVRFTLAAEFATRNVAIATAIAVTLLQRVDFAVFATTYFLVELPLMLAAVAVFRSREATAGSH